MDWTKKLFLTGLRFGSVCSMSRQHLNLPREQFPNTLPSGQ
jgi:hypothetical protein